MDASKNCAKFQSPKYLTQVNNILMQMQQQIFDRAAAPKKHNSSFRKIGTEAKKPGTGLAKKKDLKIWRIYRLIRFSGATFFYC
jgi:hypothetical protein